MSSISDLYENFDAAALYDLASLSRIGGFASRLNETILYTTTTLIFRRYTKSMGGRSYSPPWTQNKSLMDANKLDPQPSAPSEIFPFFPVPTSSTSSLKSTFLLPFL